MHPNLVRRLVILFAVALGFAACKTSSEPVVMESLQIRLDAVPLLLKADTLESSVIWATIIEDGEPVADSTTVFFAATNGDIAASAYTVDGLAQASFVPGFETGTAAIIAQVRTVRDTVVLTLY